MMQLIIQYYASVGLFALFVVMVLIRASMLRKRNIQVIVFGQTDKSDFLLVPCVILVAYTILANTFGLPVWNALTRPFWNGGGGGAAGWAGWTGWVGLTLCAAAMAGFALALASFGDSFRVGIDVNTPDKLVTGGMFSISRNPIYVCFLLFFAGLFLIHRNITVAVGAVLFALAIHRQVKREEAFLASHYGAEYEEYCKKTRRYL